jgi:hypothetical protein
MWARANEKHWLVLAQLNLGRVACREHGSSSQIPRIFPQFALNGAGRLVMRACRAGFARDAMRGYRAAPVRDLTQAIVRRTPDSLGVGV